MKLQNMKNFLSNKLILVLVLVIAGMSAYFINIEVQSYWGRQAVKNTGLKSLPLEQAVSKAKAENKLVLVDVAAIWCPTCRKLDREVLANEEVRNVINEKFVFSRLEYESSEGAAFLEKHNTTGFPNLWLIDGNGNPVKQLKITFDPAQLIKQIQ